MPARGPAPIPARALGLFALLLAASPASAHKFSPTRALRLQLTGKSLEGLLTYRQPAGQGADLLVQIPNGVAPGEAPIASAEDRLQALAKRLAGDALRGLRVQAGRDAAPRPPRLVESNARTLPGGGVEAAYLLRFDAAPAAGETLTLFADRGLPLSVELIARTGLQLTLVSGLGKAVAGGLSLLPRPAAPCTVLVAPAPPPEAPPQTPPPQTSPPSQPPLPAQAHP